MIQRGPCSVDVIFPVSIMSSSQSSTWEKPREDSHMPVEKESSYREWDKITWIIYVTTILYVHLQRDDDTYYEFYIKKCIVQSCSNHFSRAFPKPNLLCEHSLPIQWLPLQSFWDVAASASVANWMKQTSSCQVMRLSNSWGYPIRKRYVCGSNCDTPWLVLYKNDWVGGSKQVAQRLDPHPSPIVLQSQRFPSCPQS